MQSCLVITNLLGLRYDYKQSYVISKSLFLHEGLVLGLHLLLFSLEPKNSSEKAILYLITASLVHFLLNEFPVFAVLVEQVYQL